MWSDCLPAMSPGGGSCIVAEKPFYSSNGISLDLAVGSARCRRPCYWICVFCSTAPARGEHGERRGDAEVSQSDYRLVPTCQPRGSIGHRRFGCHVSQRRPASIQANPAAVI